MSTVVGQNANRTKCQPDIMPTKGWHFVRIFKKVWLLLMVCNSLLNSSFVLEYTSFLIILSRDGLSRFSILFSLLKIHC